MANVIFKFGTRAQYDALTSKDVNTLYWLTDTLELMKGEDCYGKGSEASNLASGLMSAADKQKLDSIGDPTVAGLTPVDASIVLADSEDGGKTIGVGLSGDPDNILAVRPDGLFAAVETVSINKVEGLESRLGALEQAVVGGVRYKGSVSTVESLPTDAAQGDLYEILEDNSEWCWNGEAWFEYGKTTDIDLSGYAQKDFVEATTVGVKYEVVSKPDGALVDYTGNEIRVMCPIGTAWAQQAVGENGDPSKYYIGFRAYAPNDSVVSFKEDTAATISDETMYYFENNEFAGVDGYGRKYSVVWLPVAAYDAETDTWTYYGAKSSSEKYIGWYYSVEWYNADGNVVAADTVRINMANEDCYTSVTPFYVSSIQAAVNSLSEGLTWGEI